MYLFICVTISLNSIIFHEAAWLDDLCTEYCKSDQNK